MAVLKYNCAECGAEIITTSYDNLKHKHGNLVFCCTDHFNSYFLRKDCERARAENNKRLNAIKAEWDERASQAEKKEKEYYANKARIAKEKYERSHKDTVSVDGVLYSSDRLWLVEVPKDTETFDVPEGVIEICYKAFAECENLASVKLPDTLKIIDQEAFLNCKNLTSITIPSSVTKVGDGAFENCESLKDLVISEGVIELGGSCFYHCKSLESVTIPKSIKKIGYGMDYDETDWFDSTIKGLFKRCTSLSTVILPEGMEEIPTGMFDTCTALKTISIPETVRIIGKSAFYSSGLESITIPASVTHIEDRAFQHCSNLQSVEYLGDEPSIGDYVFDSCGFVIEQEEREAAVKAKKESRRELLEKILTFIYCPFKNLVLFNYNIIGTIIGVVLWFFTLCLLDIEIVKLIIFSILATSFSKTIPDMIIYKGDCDRDDHNKIWKIIYYSLSFVLPGIIIVLFFLLNRIKYVD